MVSSMFIGMTDSISKEKRAASAAAQADYEAWIKAGNTVTVLPSCKTGEALQRLFTTVKKGTQNKAGTKGGF